MKSDDFWFALCVRALFERILSLASNSFVVEICEHESKRDLFQAKNRILYVSQAATTHNVIEHAGLWFSFFVVNVLLLLLLFLFLTILMPTYTAYKHKTH